MVNRSYQSARANNNNSSGGGGGGGKGRRDQHYYEQLVARQLPSSVDATLVDRVKQYMDSAGLCGYVELDELAGYLRARHADYRRLKRLAFRLQVQRAYECVAKVWRHQYATTSDSESESLAAVEAENGGGAGGEMEEDNSINQSLTEVYSRSVANTTAPPLGSTDQRQSQQPPPTEPLLQSCQSTASGNPAGDNNRPPQAAAPDSSCQQQPQQQLAGAAAAAAAAVDSGKQRRRVPKRKQNRQDNDYDSSGGGAGGGATAGTRHKSFGCQKPQCTLSDFGGNPAAIAGVCDIMDDFVDAQLMWRALQASSSPAAAAAGGEAAAAAGGVVLSRGLLLYGPAGSGKSLLAACVAGELRLPLLACCSTELVSGVSGDSEQLIRQLFDSARRAAPCVLFIDEIDALTAKRETAQREMERRIVAQLLACFDQLAVEHYAGTSSSSSSCGDGDGEAARPPPPPPAAVLVIAAASLPDHIDVALRRAKRFDHELTLGMPDATARADILRVLCRRVPLAADVALNQMALLSPGFVGADLYALVGEAQRVARQRARRSHSQAAASPSALLPHCSSSSLTAAATTAAANSMDTSEPSPPPAQTPAPLSSSSPHIAGQVATEERVCNSSVAPPAAAVAATSSSSSELVSRRAALARRLRLLTDGDTAAVAAAVGAYCRAPVTDADFRQALQRVQPSALREGFASVPDVRWSDVGALAQLRQELNSSILDRVRQPDYYASLGLSSGSGVLICGPPGCGKTLVAKAVANEAGINFLSVKGPEIFNMYVGESERAVRQLFLRARNSAPCVIFFDEIDSLCQRRGGEGGGGGEGGSSARVVNQLLTEMDGLGGRGGGVFVMAATNRPDIIDPAVLRPGRIDKLLYVGIPDRAGRGDILRAVTRGGSRPPLGADVCLDRVAADGRCLGLTGADLANVVREAAELAARERHHQLQWRHLDAALDRVRPSVSAEQRHFYDQMRQKCVNRNCSADSVPSLP